jgi:hypothetical protein
VLDLEGALNALAGERAAASETLRAEHEAAGAALAEQLRLEVEDPFRAAYMDPVEGVGRVETPRAGTSTDEARLIVRQTNADILGRREAALQELLTDTADAAAIMAADGLVTLLEEREEARQAERAAPGTCQEEFLRTSLLSADGQTVLQLADLDLPEAEKAVVSRRPDRLVLEMGIKTNFREGKARWYGHVSVRVTEGLSFDPVNGVGRRFRIHVFDSVSSQEFEGVIRSTKHLQEILGVHGRDLLARDRTTEMLMFICRYKLDMVNNSTTPDGEPLDDPDAPAYRIEFQVEKRFDKSVAGQGGEGEEEEKQGGGEQSMLEADKRGKKILRAAKRVSGVLLQLIVFELPLTDAEEQQQFEEEMDRDRAAAAELERAEEARAALSERPDTALTAADADAGTRPGTAEAAGTGTGTGGGDDDEEEEVEYTRPKRRQRIKLEKCLAPSFRIVGFDPRSKLKCTYIVTNEATIEIAGGAYSMFLNKDKRRELARIVCDGLQCIFEPGSFQLFLAFAGAVAFETGAPPIERRSARASADQVAVRPGKIFRSAMRISDLDLLVTIYATPPDPEAREGGEQHAIMCTFYIQAATKGVDIAVSEKIQKEYLGKPLVKIQEGLPRAMSIRKLCHYFKAKLRDDRKNQGCKLLLVDLLPLKGGFIQEFRQVGMPKPGQDIRPVGCPAIFMPPDTCGVLLHRRGTRLFDKILKAKTDVEYVVSVHTKSAQEGCERGLVVKIYDRGGSSTMILHIGPSEISRLMLRAGQMGLLADIAAAREADTDSARDALEANFETLTEKSENLRMLKKMYDTFTNVIIDDVGIKPNPVGEPSLYLRTARTEPV